MRTTRHSSLFLALLWVGGVATACDKKDDTPPVDAKADPVAAAEPHPAAEPVAPAPAADADAKAPAEASGEAVSVTLESAQGKEVSGTLTFKPGTGGVEVEGKISGLTPGKHGFHVHEKGDCSAPDFSSAGGHFNPTKNEHGSPTDENRHAGDLGNVEVAEDGTATIAFTIPEVSLDSGAEKSLLGRSIVVHEKADDLKSQPSGDAGGRVGCGVIAKSS